MTPLEEALAVHLAEDAVRATRIDELVTEQRALSELLARGNDEIAMLRARLDHLDPWQVHYEYKLTAAEPWKKQTGFRPSVDSSRGSATMVSFPSIGGMQLKAQRQPDGTILSCDVISTFGLPPGPHWALEADIQFTGYLGVGMFPCPFWSKQIGGGGGELDGVEFMGGRTDELRWKMTAILLPVVGQIIQRQRALAPFMANLGWFGTITWRWEKTDGRFELFINGVPVGAITREEFDAEGPINPSTKRPYWPAQPGRWDAMFENPSKSWYTRHTWQVGPPTDGTQSASAGKVPADWTESSMLFRRMVAYRPRAA